MTRVTLLPISAMESADVSGIGCEIAVITWAGILIPEAGRGRRFALKQLQFLAELNGFPVRNT
jgi:hypothetical protein